MLFAKHIYFVECARSALSSIRSRALCSNSIDGSAKFAFIRECPPRHADVTTAMKRHTSDGGAGVGGGGVRRRQTKPSGNTHVTSTDRATQPNTHTLKRQKIMSHMHASGHIGETGLGENMRSTPRSPVLCSQSLVLCCCCCWCSPIRRGGTLVSCSFVSLCAQ